MAIQSNPNFQKKTNWAAIIPALAAVGIGSFIVYMMYKKTPPITCIEGDTKCIGNDLYKCVNGEWIVDTVNTPACTPYTVDVLINPTGSGTVSGVGIYYAGDTVILTATPASGTGYGFDYWVINGETIRTNPLVFTMPASNIGINLYFKEVGPYQVVTNVTPDNAGSVTGAGWYNVGDTVTLTATANQNYQFVEWWTNFGGVITDNPLSFSMIPQNVVCTAIFQSTAPPYEYYTSNPTALESICSAYDGKYLAQTFTVGAVGQNIDHYISSVKLLLSKSGNPGIFRVYIFPTINGVPNINTNYLTVGYQDSAMLPESFPTEYTEIFFNSTPKLLANTTYAIILEAYQCLYGISAVAWARDNGTPGYSGGKAFYYTAATNWVNLNKDFMFVENGHT